MIQLDFVERVRKENRKIKSKVIVVYFDQRLGAAHSKGWQKYAFSMFFCLEAEKNAKKEKFAAKIRRFLRLHQTLADGFLGNKTLDQRLGANFKKTVF